MSSPYQFGTHSDETEALQEVLKRLSLYAGKIDGDYGTKTRDAVTEAQHLYAISPADGVVRADLLLELGITTPKPPASNPFSDFLTGIAIKAALNSLKGLPIVNFLTGYKTYIIGIFLIAAGGLEFFGIIIPGMTGDPTALIATGIGLITGRVATANVAAGK